MISVRLVLGLAAMAAGEAREAREDMAHKATAPAKSQGVIETRTLGFALGPRTGTGEWRLTSGETRLTNPATGTTCTLRIQAAGPVPEVGINLPIPEVDSGMVRSLSPCVPAR